MGWKADRQEEIWLHCALECLCGSRGQAWRRSSDQTPRPKKACLTGRSCLFVHVDTSGGLYLEIVAVSSARVIYIVLDCQIMANYSKWSAPRLATWHIS